MSTHPNTLLIAAFTPQDLARKTMRAILADCDHDQDDEEVKIDGLDFHYEIMETEWDKFWQISSLEGDLLFFRFVTYGYGRSITWDDLEKAKQSLETWAKAICEKHHCTYQIRIAANYW